jgi:hypothetical protein
MENQKEKNGEEDFTYMYKSTFLLSDSGGRLRGWQNITNDQVY